MLKHFFVWGALPNGRFAAVQNVDRSADLKIDYILLAKIQRVKPADRNRGSKPDPAIFHRPVLRCQIPCHRYQGSGGNNRKRGKKTGWNHPSTVSVFANALVAVQQLSYGSTKVKRPVSHPIDDIAIANAIVRSCDGDNGGNTQQATVGCCCNFLWAWGEEGEEEEDGGAIDGSTSPPPKTRGRQRPDDRGAAMILPSCCPASVGSSGSALPTSGSSGSNDDDGFSLLRLCWSSDSTADSEMSEI